MNENPITGPTTTDDVEGHAYRGGRVELKKQDDPTSMTHGHAAPDTDADEKTDTEGHLGRISSSAAAPKAEPWTRNGGG